MTMDCVKIGTSELYLGDCADVIPILPVVDTIITDPPYNEVNRESGGLRLLDKGVADSAVVDIPLMSRLLIEKFRGSIYVWCGTEQVSYWREELVKAGLTTRLCIWEKSNPSPMNGDKLWLSSIECCVFARKSKATFNVHCKSPVWRGPICPGQVHPTEKPVWLIKEAILASTKPNDLILDCYMGSGTTGVAAIATGRKFIGIEKEKNYFDIACRRIKAEYRTHHFH